ncbi:MAG: oxidoreductase [Myxococcota bacterium]
MSSAPPKVAVVTGANTGLGFETSLALAREGYRVVLACRSEAKARGAIDKIKAKVPAAELSAGTLDLIDRDSVRRFAEAFGAEHPRLDLLVNNAGVMGPPYTITPNQVELQFDANHLGHFLLTQQLFERLDQADETRIVNVSSLAGKRSHADIYFDNLNFEGNYDEGYKFMGLGGMVAYSQSKLANILFTMELRDRCATAGKKVKAVVAHPGVSNTDLARNMSFGIRLFAPILIPLMGVSTSAEGAQSLVFAAVDPSMKAGEFIGPTGKDERKGPPGRVELPAKAQDKALAERLWSRSEELLEVDFSI